MPGNRACCEAGMVAGMPQGWQKPAGFPFARQRHAHRIDAKGGVGAVTSAHAKNYDFWRRYGCPATGNDAEKFRTSSIRITLSGLWIGRVHFSSINAANAQVGGTNNETSACRDVYLRNQAA
jgi:hypothetical protein